MNFINSSLRKFRLGSDTDDAYRPLNTAKKEIRLVELMPGDFDQDIYCNIKQASLYDKPKYIALSYVWGDPHSTRPIYVNGRRRKVTKKLQVALRGLRSKTEVKKLWIDAICINQFDISERNVQVIHMDEVYKEATSVIAWLGESNKESKLAYESFRAFPDEQGHWDPLQTLTLEEKFFSPEYIAAIEEFFAREWWHRIWTVQESVLCPNLYFACGPDIIAAERLGHTCEGWFVHAFNCCETHLFAMGYKRFYALNSCWRAMAELHRKRLNKADWRLADHLATTRGRDCADPRDKIYGLLGLCRDEDKDLVKPNYALPVDQVYKQFVMSWVERWRSLLFLTLICPRHFKGMNVKEKKLPSWVPDWTAQGDYRQWSSLYNRQTRLHFYSASSTSAALIEERTPGRLTIRGRVVEPIDFIGAMHPGAGLMHSIEDLRSWRRHAEVESNPDRPYPQNDNPLTTYSEAFWQTMVGSIFPSRKYLHDVNQNVRASTKTPLHRQWHDAWWTWRNEFLDADLPSVGKEFTGAELNSFNGLHDDATDMRTFFMSKGSGLIGLCPTDAQIGDVIVVLEGGDVPYILRPGTGADDDCFEFIGDAYVHGIMDGEAWIEDQLGLITLV